MNTTKEPRGPRISAETLHIKDLRTKLHMTQEDLSVKSGISKDLIDDYEAMRKYPPVDVTEALAHALGVSYEQLMGIDLTGYPSIDKPWKKYYCREAFTTEFPEGNIFKLIYEKNKDRLDELAIEYLKTRVTYGQLFDYIEKARNSFAKLGVKAGDVVTMALPNIPENVYCVYGLNRLGATANMVDLRLSGEKLIESIKSVNSNIVVCSDVFAANIAEIQNQVDVDHWIILSPYDSTPQLVRGFLKWKNKRPAVKEISNRLTWNEFLKIGIGVEAEDYEGKTDEVACIFHTSGTTSLPKAVMMTNGNMNALGFCYEFTPVDTRPRDRFLSHIPPFLAYNTIFTIHMPMVLQMTVVMVPLCPIEEFAQVIMKNKPNHVGGSSALWREFAKDPKTRDFDFSFLKGMACGNDSMELDKKQLVNQILEKGGSKDKILEGYGMTEAGSAVSSCWPNIYPADSSIGIPLCCNTISIFDMEDPDKELKYHEHGEICVQGPSVMKGYYGDPETTAQVLKKHSDGKIWLHSGDLGYMNEEGCLYFLGRLKRTIVTYKGFKIAPLEIEQVIRKHENVEACCVVGQPDTELGSGQVPAAFLVLRDPANSETLAEVKELVEKNIQPEYYVNSYTVIEKLPMTPNGKVDFRFLETYKG